MIENNPLFCLPARLETERPFGHHTIYRNQKEKVQSFSDEADGNDERPEGVIPTATLYGTDLGTQDISDASPNILTVIGVLPHQVETLLSYFREYGYSFPNNRIDRGANWVSLVFDEAVEQIDCVNPTIQLTEYLIVSCFVGYFGHQHCRPVVKQEKGGKTEVMDLFKMKRGDDDLTGKTFEKKHLLNKVREFIFGEREIPRKRGTIIGILSDTWESIVSKL